RAAQQARDARPDRPVERHGRPPQRHPHSDVGAASARDSGGGGMSFAELQGYVGRAIAGFSSFVLVYFLAMNLSYILLFLVSLSEVLRFLRRTFFSDYQQILKSDMTLPISLLVPAHNEEKTIVDTVRSLQMLNYPEFEMIVINDGSTDDTLKALLDAFELRRV